MIGSSYTQIRRGPRVEKEKFFQAVEDHLPWAKIVPSLRPESFADLTLPARQEDARVLTGTPAGITKEIPADWGRSVVFLTIHLLASGEPSAKRNAGSKGLRGTADRTRYHSSQKKGSMGQWEPRERQKASWKESHQLALEFAMEITTARAPSVDRTSTTLPRSTGRAAYGRVRNSPPRRKPVVPKMEADTNRRSSRDILWGSATQGSGRRSKAGYRVREGSEDFASHFKFALQNAHRPVT